MLPLEFVYEHAYRTTERLFIDYCVYTYLKETYQFEDEAISLLEEIQRQGEQLVDIAKKYDCKFPLKEIAGESYTYIKHNILIKKEKFINIITERLKNIHKDIYIDKEIIEKISSDHMRYYYFFDTFLNKN